MHTDLSFKIPGSERHFSILSRPDGTCEVQIQYRSRRGGYIIVNDFIPFDTAKLAKDAILIEKLSE